jgi:hypothetical protein
MQNQEQIIGRAHVDPSNSNSRAIGDVLAMQLASITYCSLKGPNVVSKTLKKHLPQMRLVWEPTGTILGGLLTIGLNKILTFLSKYLGYIQMTILQIP